jgi:hypothetical protein
MKRKIVISGIAAALALAGTGVASAQALPSAAVAKPAPTPDNTASEAGNTNIGVVECDAAQVSYVIKGRNVKGISAWYEFSVANCDTSTATLPVKISLSGDTGDTASLYEQDPQANYALELLGSGKNVTLSPVAGVQYLVDVSGGTRDAQFTLTVTPAQNG